MTQKRHILLLLFLTQLAFGQDLYIGTESAMLLETDSKLFINGLEVTPSANYNINANTTIDLTNTSVNTGNTSILKYFNFTAPFVNYVGAIDFFFDADELNNLDVSSLKLALYTTNKQWQFYDAIVNDTGNKLSYTFKEAISFSMLTADNSKVLSTSNFTLNITPVVYPNPTKNKVRISYTNPIQTTLFNVMGQLLQTGNTDTVDLSRYANGVYFLRIKDTTSNKIKTIKIIKE